MFKEFKNFIARGNVIDMAVGIVMGAAFTAIVNSAVGDILMPIVGWMMAGVDFSGPIAQLGERLHGMQEVVGSIPIGSTIFFKKS
jgi:large conductance mechanosensitive channel